MSNLNDKGDLAAAEVAFYAPAMLLAVFVLFRQGFQFGWFYLVLLSILRIVGASATLYMETKNDYSESLLETAFITSTIGTAPLLLALLTILERLHSGMKAQRAHIPTMVFIVIHVTAVAALVLAIIGGTYESEPRSGNVPTGHDLIKAASMIFLAFYLSAAAITIITYLRRSAIVSSERKLMYACCAVLPFLLVRITYTVTVAFSTSPNSPFYFRDVIVWAEAFMQFLMEAIIVLIFIAAGLVTPRLQKPAKVSNVGLRPVQKEVPGGDVGSGDPMLPPSEQTHYQGPIRPGAFRPVRSGR